MQQHAHKHNNMHQATLTVIAADGCAHGHGGRGGGVVVAGHKQHAAHDVGRADALRARDGQVLACV